jgi:hypothetical protein
MPSATSPRGGFYREAVARAFLFVSPPTGAITQPLRMLVRQTQISVVNRACVSFLPDRGRAKPG